MESHAVAVNYSAETRAGSERRARDRVGRLVRLALGALVIAALLVGGFFAYRNPGLALSLENLRLCF